MKKLLFCSLGIILLFPSFSQNLDSEEALLAWHDEQIGILNLGIINGPIYEFRRASKFTHRFYKDRKWNKGSVVIDGQTYFELDLVYDLLIDSLILRHPDVRYTYGIALQNVDGFEIHNSEFVRIKNSDMEDGFYQKLYQGNQFELYAKWEKEEKISATGVSNFIESVNYYWKYDSYYTRYTRFKSILSEFPEKKSMIRRLKKENRLKPVTSQPDQIIRLLEILDENL